MKEFTELRQLSGNLAAIVRDHPEEQPEERFYGCRPELIVQLQPSISWQEDTLALGLHTYCQAHRFRMPPEKQGHIWGHAAIGGREAEERWPTLILAGQLQPIQVHPLGVQRATWSELLWGVDAYCNSRSISGALGRSEEPKPSDLNRLAILRWRARWAPAQWLQPAETAPELSQAITMDDQVPRDRNQLFGQTDVIRMMAEATCRSGKRWSSASWQEQGWQKLMYRAEIDRMGPLEGLAELETTLQLIPTQDKGHQEWRFKRADAHGLRSRIWIAWAPFPEGGERTTLVALRKQNDRVAIALISREEST